MVKAPGNAPRTAVVNLDVPLKRGDTTVDKITLRSPAAGELRGIKLLDLTQFDVATIIKILPRISDPSIHEIEANNLAFADLIEIGNRISDFLPQVGQNSGSPAE